MRDLKTLREGWDEVAQAERRSAEHLRPEQSVRIYLSLYEAMASEMEKTEETYRREREDHLIELQARLLRLNAHSRRNQPDGNLSEPA